MYATTATNLLLGSGSLTSLASAPPPTACTPPPTTNLASGRAQLAFRGDVPCKLRKRRMRVSHARRSPAPRTVVVHNFSHGP
ncbi:hypothetical protein PF008_g29166 [Phytophthora fragariae]|uniref:Secreted protein n=1 Tax=Phytophthora fragariae TaxID=53985 RepID=A0A6G0Q9A0_9STRA|nr:hypothetical protein PF008_g29166 [Phytophthora fragariae]